MELHSLSCILIDDEQPARDELAYLLSSHPDIRVVGEADSVASAVKNIQANGPDFIFLDIQMRGNNGFEVLSGIEEMEPQPLVVFITAYDQYAVKAFEARAVDYLMKPFSPDRLAQSLERVRQMSAVRQEEAFQAALSQFTAITAAPKPRRKVAVEQDGRITLLNPEDIVFCQYRDKRIMVHTRLETYLVHGIHTLDQLEKHLDGDLFFRNHRSTLVNFDQIQEFSPWFNGKYHIRMKDQGASELTVTRDRVRRFKALLGLR
ncbi:MAG: LytTR family DNA-binding domain-containing protein [Desulfobacterales bacterium]|nr:LytTR family DNA-binding domain-containing protein [Desulfobacterales bacterium]